MTEVKLSTEKPLIYDKLRDKFNVLWDDGVIIANGDTIYCKYQVPPEKVVHELVHLKQQEKIGKDLWWELYLAKDSFRLEQEVEAFQKEYKFICDNIKDRNGRFEYLYECARILSSKQYGPMCSMSEALALIQA